ncbi:MAG: DUF4349 domain-containing protein [Bacteroidota bacterium]
MKTKPILYPVALVFLCAIMFSCGNSKRSYRSTGYNNASYLGITGTTSDKTSETETQSLIPPGRMMVYNANVTVVVKKPDTANVRIIKIAKKYNGYVLNTGSTYTTIRVKADSLYCALAEITALGTVKNKNVYAEDITEEYTNLTIRFENALKARTRYLELLEEAANVEETLAVEKELERLNTDIDLLEGKINKLDHLEEYSTITVYIQKKVKPGPVGFVLKYLYKGVKYLFVWD